jgi:alcohol dehydrogenase
MTGLLESVGVPTALGAFEGFEPGHIDRAIAAAKNPQLAMKLKAMPMPMDAAAVDKYMRPALEAAAAGDIAKVPTLPV